MSPKIGTAKPADKKSVADDVAAFNAKLSGGNKAPAVGLTPAQEAAVDRADREVGEKRKAERKARAEKPAKPTPAAPPAPSPEPATGKQDAPTSSAKPVALKPLVIAKGRVSLARVEWYRTLVSNAPASKKRDDALTRLDDVIDRLTAALVVAVEALPEQGIAPEFKVRAGRGGKAKPVEGSKVRIVEKSRKRFSLVVKDPSEYENATVTRAAEGQFVVAFPGGGQSIARKADIEVVS